MSEQYRCSECGHFVEIQDDAICDVCNIGKMQHLRYIRGGEGSHWEGCEEVHWDCKIMKLEKEIARLLERDIELDVERRSHRWIPVSERLPNRDGFYLILENVNQVAGYYHWCKQFGWNTDGGRIHIQTVTHWMPLPPPPEEE